MNNTIGTSTAFVVLRNKKSREFRRLFFSLEAANAYIKCGKDAGINLSDEEFVEQHTVRDN